jgi:hypothetical protein
MDVISSAIKKSISGLPAFARLTGMAFSGELLSLLVIDKNLCAVGLESTEEEERNDMLLRTPIKINAANNR